MNNKLLVIGCLIIYFLTIFLLLTGHPILVFPLIAAINLPWGTLITWALSISLPLAIFLGNKRLNTPQNKVEYIFRWLLICILGLSILYGFIARILAMDWAFNFSNQVNGFWGSPAASEWFWAISYGLVGAPLVFLVLWWIYLLVQWLWNRKKTD